MKVDAQGFEKMLNPDHWFPNLSAHWSHLRLFVKTNAQVLPPET